MQWIATEIYPDAEKIILVQDNYKAHSYGAFYENLPPAQAHALKRKIEFHFTPKHASWLNMAEIEFSALAKQCLTSNSSSFIQRLATSLIDGKALKATRKKVNYTLCG